MMRSFENHVADVADVLTHLRENGFVEAIRNYNPDYLPIVTREVLAEYEKTMLLALTSFQFPQLAVIEPVDPLSLPTLRLACDPLIGEHDFAAFQGGGSIFTEPVLVVNQKAKLIELKNQYSVFDQNGIIAPGMPGRRAIWA